MLREVWLQICFTACQSHDACCMHACMHAPQAASSSRPRPPQTIKAAEAALKQLSGQPAIVAELLVRLAGSPSTEVRQLAAVLLRKRITKHWTKLAQPVSCPPTPPCR